MLKSVCGTAAAMLIIAAVCLCIGIGGCGKSRSHRTDLSGALCTAPKSAKSTTPPEPDTAEPGWEIGATAGLVGKLEEPVRVTATLYPAEGGIVRGADVRVQPGAWIIPESVILPPDTPAGQTPAKGGRDE